MTADLITRLRAALDAQETTARAAANAYGDTWTARDEGWVSSDTNADILSEPDAPTDHIAAHDPAFVLADITAKRAVIDLHRPIRQRSTGSGGGTIDDCAICDAYPAQYPCATLRLLAEAYGITEDGPTP